MGGNYTKKLKFIPIKKGDSGGGVIGQFEDASFGGVKRWFLLGVISFGKSCIGIHLEVVNPVAQASLRFKIIRLELFRGIHMHDNIFFLVSVYGSKAVDPYT